jgi:hypothetical protein
MTRPAAFASRGREVPTGSGSRATMMLIFVLRIRHISPTTMTVFESDDLCLKTFALSFHPLKCFCVDGLEREWVWHCVIWVSRQSLVSLWGAGFFVKICVVQLMLC